MSKPIPQRAPIGDALNGVVLTVGSTQVLALEPIAEVRTIVSGALTLRYGVRFLGKPQLSIVPGLVALDYGDLLVGDEAWNFILHRSNRYPRAEVYGYRNDGRDEMCYIKQLDLALPVEVLTYTSPSATTTAARPVALIAPVQANLPPRVIEYLPRYDSLASWASA